MRNKRVTIFSLIVLLSLMMSLVFPTGVLADDNPPPSTETPEVVTPPEEAATDTVVPETVATEEPVLTEETVTQDASADTGSTANDVALLSQLPEGTEVVVSNADGEIVPLGSQEAVDIIAVQDPLWCPVGQAPTPGANGCTTNFANSQALIDAMDSSNPATTTPLTTYEQDGIIYFTVNPGTGSFTLVRGNNGPGIDNADYDILKAFNLILQGGWDGTPGSTTFTQTNFGANPLTIGAISNPWGGNISLNDFVFSGVSSTSSIKIYTAGDITLDNVTANLNTTNDGARLDNTSGSGSVTVTGSTFNQNNDDGLNVRSNGLITLVDVTANQNGNDGANLGNNGANATSNIEVIASRFNNNNVDGLYADSKGNITLINVTAQNNGDDGVELIFPNNGTHTATICGGVFSGQVGANDFDVQVNNGTTLTRSSDITVVKWSPITGWTSIANGTGLCDYPDTDADLIPNQWDATPTVTPITMAWIISLTTVPQ